MVLPSSEFIDLWNFYFEMAVTTGVYERICNAAPQRHGSEYEYVTKFQAQLLDSLVSFFANEAANAFITGLSNQICHIMALHLTEF